MSLPCPISDLIPQKGKMGFEQTLVKAKNDDMESRAIIAEDNIFLTDNHRLSNVSLVEYVNQLIAAVHGYNGNDSNKAAEKGLFVGIQEAEFFQPVYAGDPLTIKAFVTEEFSQISFVRGIIYRSADKIADLTTKLYEVKDSAEFDLLMNNGQVHQGKSGFKLNNQTAPAYLDSGMRRKLYTYLQDIAISESMITFDITCQDDFDAFKGHFPGNPILPGVVLLEIADLALELLLKRPVVIQNIKKMKISGVVLPGQRITCEAKVEQNQGLMIAYSVIVKGGAGREISRFSGYCMLTDAYDKGRE